MCGVLMVQAISSGVARCRQHTLVGDRWERSRSAKFIILSPTQIWTRDLLSKNFPLLLESRSNGLMASAEVSGEDSSNLHVDLQSKVSPKAIDLSKEASLRSWLREDNPSFLDLKVAAFVAANTSYAPYSKCPSGLALITRDGVIYSGSYMESAAYNPGLPALQAAIVAFICGGGGDYDEIEAVVLVELKGALVRYASTARLALQSIAPLASFHHFDAEQRDINNHTS